MLTTEQDKSLTDIASVFNLKKQDLYDMIKAESGWDPTIKNKQGAEYYGLLQFGKDAATNMEYIDENGNVKSYTSGKDIITINPTIDKQLAIVDKNNLNNPKNGPVVQYLANTGLKKVSSPTIYDLIAAVFMPAAMGKPTNIPLYTFLPASKKDKFIQQNPGIITIEDYANKMGLAKNGTRSNSSYAQNKKISPTSVASVASAVTPLATSVIQTVTAADKNDENSKDDAKSDNIQVSIPIDSEEVKGHVAKIMKSLSASPIRT